MDIIYSGYVRETRFIENLQGYMDGHGIYVAHTQQDVLDALEWHNALVLVGKQHNIFHTSEQYFEMQEKAREFSLRLLAIQGEQETLYSNNRGLDKIISREGKSIPAVALEIGAALN